MPRLAWILVVGVAAATACVTWLVVAGGRHGSVPVDPAGSRDAEVRQLRAENEGLRRRVEDALSTPARLTGRPEPEPERPPTAAEEAPAPEVTGIEHRVQRIPPATDPLELLKELVRRGRLHDLLREIATDGNARADVRVAAVKTLIATDEEMGLALLAWLMDSPGPLDRRVAFGVLSNTNDAALAPLLRVALEHPDRPEDVPALQQATSRLKGRGWSPRQATGEPDTHQAGDIRTAWASKQGDMGEVWLELDYERAVVPDAVRVHETFNAGAIARVEAKRADGSGYDVLWEGTATQAEAPNWFEPVLAAAPSPISTIRVVLDTDRVKGWNEIDAVGLVGDGIEQWAIAARASSSYGAP